MYVLCKSFKEIEGKIYEVFGIECDNMKIDDISTDRERVEHLIKLANELSLSTIHIRDAVLDFIL